MSSIPKIDLEKILVQVAATGDLHAVQQMVAAGASVDAAGWAGRTALHQAASKGHADIVEFLLANKANPNIDDEFGETPLHIAVATRHLDVAKKLLDGGADPNYQFASLMTPLYTAVISDLMANDPACSRLLLVHGADPGIKMNYSTRMLTVREILETQVDENAASFLEVFDVMVDTMAKLRDIVENINSEKQKFLAQDKEQKIHQSSRGQGRRFKL